MKEKKRTLGVKPSGDEAELNLDAGSLQQINSSHHMAVGCINIKYSSVMINIGETIPESGIKVE